MKCKKCKKEVKTCLDIGYCRDCMKKYILYEHYKIKDIKNKKEKK